MKKYYLKVKQYEYYFIGGKKQQLKAMYYCITWIIWEKTACR